jgi:hypothetical protein
MSALGQTQTWDCRPLMSALPPKAGHCSARSAALCQRRLAISAHIAEKRLRPVVKDEARQIAANIVNRSF